MVLVIALGALIGWALGGRLHRITSAPVRLAWAAVAGLALQWAPLPGRLAMWALYASFALLVIFAAANLRRSGFALVLLGIGLNLAVITANDGMPVSARAIEVSGQASTLGEIAADGDGVKHHLAGDGTRLVWLGDVIGVPRPIGQVISAGDIVVAAGMAWFIVAGMLGRPQGRRRRPRAAAASQVSRS
jgi:hypothetical protein